MASTVILPDVGEPPFATFYLLHGLSDDHTIWLRRTSIERYVERLPLIVVMPDGFRGFYTNNDQGPAYATYLADELPAIIERNFPARSDRTGRCIGGLSMGGYGALRTALANPDRYISANSHSGALLHGGKQWADPKQAEYRRIFGDSSKGSDHDLLNLAQKAPVSGSVPALRIDCGTDDFLIDDNRSFHAALNGMGLGHEYDEYPGEHNWAYWDTHVQTALKFHCRHVGIKPL